MGGTADLDNDILVDSFVTDIVDSLRRDLHGAFGVRPYKLSLVRRAWSGELVGEGTMTETITEYDPAPKVTYNWGSYQVMKVKQEACGLDIDGDIEVTELSLSYTEAELGYNVYEPGVEYFLMLTEGGGQKSAPKYFVHSRPPYIDREKDIGWCLTLKHK